MRILCCLLLLWSVLLSGCGESKEDAAVVAIKDLGGAVGFEKTISGKPVVSVYFTDTDVTDAGLVHLKGMTSLRTLWLYKVEVTDAGLVHLKGMTSCGSP
jgi:hypothetical protein